MKKVLKFLWRCVGVLYFPIYLLAWVLHKIARLMLAIAYFGLLNKQAGKDIIKNYFDKVIVMDKDEAIKNNRLSQMRFLTYIFTKMADLNQIEER